MPVAREVLGRSAQAFHGGNGIEAGRQGVGSSNVIGGPSVVEIDGEHGEPLGHELVRQRPDGGQKAEGVVQHKDTRSDSFGVSHVPGALVAQSSE